MMLSKLAITLSEHHLIPDFMIRYGIRQLCKKRLQEVSASNCEHSSDLRSQFFDAMKLARIAPLPEMAKAQHYEVPAAFFNLTLGAPLGPMPNFAPKGVFPPLSKILRLSARGRLPLAEIREETHRQLDRFEAVMERSPDHFDGHQHVHVVGDIRETILDVLTERGLQGEIWLRDVSDTVPRVIMRKTAIGKALSLRTLARGFAKEAQLRGFTVNDGFSGLSNFDPAQNYADHFSRYLLGLGARHLIMCHPGHVDAALLALDSVTQTREQELEFLISPHFPELLQQKGLMLARLSQM